MADTPAPLQRQGQQSPARPPDHLSATDEDHASDELVLERSSPPKAPFDVFTPKGFRPFYPPEPEPIQSDELNPYDNPLNPRGQPSLSLPQQATPLTSEQGVMSIDDMADPERRANIAATQDGLAPDDPSNPRGTPDYITDGITDPDAPLRLQQVNPSTAPVSTSPLTLEILGQGFNAQSAVTIDGAPAASVSYVNQNRLAATFTPDTAGIKQVAVDGSNTLPFEVTTEGTDVP